MSGVLAAILSTALGGTAIVATRLLAGAADPTTIGVLRFGGGAVLLIPLVPQGRAVANSWRLACRDWPRPAVFRRLPCPVQRRADLYDCGSRRAGPLHHAPNYDAGRCPSPDRASDCSQERRSRAGHGRRGDCLGSKPICLPAGRLARGCSDARRSRLHGALHGLVTTPDPALGPNLVRCHGHGDRGSVSWSYRLGCGRDRGSGDIRTTAVGRCAVSCDRVRGWDLLSVEFCAG